MSTYKGFLYVIVTSIILYLLLSSLVKKIDLAEKKNRAIIEAIPDLLFVIDSEGHFIDCMTSDESLLLMPKEAFIGKTLWEVLPKEISKIAYEKIQLVFTSGAMENFEYELEFCNKLQHYELRMVKNNEKEVLAISRNVTVQKQNELELKKSENKLKYLSYHDQLTGLYNRRFFEEELSRLDEQRSLPLPLTIIMADVNGLKLVNDSFGHGIGDEFLKKVAEVMRRGCRVTDVISRLGGDEFVILLPKTDTYEAEQIIKRIKTIALKEKVGSVDISVSFGYETKNNEEEKIQDVLKKAEDNMYKKKLFESPSMRGKTINTIISTLHEKNKREEQHSHRVSILCESMGKALGLAEDEIKELKIVGLLHDIGKIAIEENVLNKQGQLTEEEWKEIKRHPEIGYRILSTVNDMSEMAEYVLAHHERWDGMGYPKGLKGKEISLQSRIITIVDSYDAMISERSYRNALPEEVAIEELKINAGLQFDPELIKVFIEKVLNKPFD
ncbi:HD domain-containing phosphohydrolase [Romboutsia sp.]|uniref:HD domain-containing phosphohydrolase n=1 Tax=Romboutsia sp. TaxID=1965302 RepID=UPI002F404197